MCFVYIKLNYLTEIVLLWIFQVFKFHFLDTELILGKNAASN